MNQKQKTKKKELKDKEKEETLNEISREIDNGNGENYNVEKLIYYLKAIAIGIKYLVKNSK
jgi:hypothetical protein